jgi:hypothetical protein
MNKQQYEQYKSIVTGAPDWEFDGLHYFFDSDAWDYPDESISYYNLQTLCAQYERIEKLEKAISVALYGDILPDTYDTRDDNGMFRNFANPDVLRKHMDSLVSVLENKDA